MLKVLFVASEAHPLIKTGGLGDVAGSLPAALQAQGCDVRLLLPGYRTALERAGNVESVTQMDLPQAVGGVRLLECRPPGTGAVTWLADCPPAYDRAGGPYLDPLGHPWADNAERFALLGRVAASIALGEAGISWRPDVVHANDWQTGLTPVFMMHAPQRPATVFTIHNLAYQGLFASTMLARLGLPASLWTPDSLEFHGQMSFIKGGLVYGDMLSTVSPTYAREIQAPDLGFGLDGLLRHRAQRLVGILNGIDDREWDPARDPLIARNYDRGRIRDKRINKRALQLENGLEEEPQTPLIAMVSRLVRQKGIDLVLDSVPYLMRQGVQIAFLGTGERSYEDALAALAMRHPGRVAVRLGYDETAAHRFESGADMFLMPSRFEPCGLNQLYSLRYGTVPIVRRVGGLADTVVDASKENLRAAVATGIVFDGDGPAALVAAMARALSLYGDHRSWESLVARGMQQDFSWRTSAQGYINLYRSARQLRR
ncbi:MAG: glycogen synthase GlgA [Acidiferrobacterales bacterium]